MTDNLPAQRKPAPPGWYPNGDVLWWWDGTAWIRPAPQPPQPPAKQSSRTTVWVVWCLLWALFWVFFFWPFALVSVGAALIPWGGDR